MCTVILFYKVVPNFPIVLAANRDEFTDRSSLPPHLWSSVWQDQTKEIFAGKDQQAGGTWLGINNYGVMAGLTNYYTGKRDPLKATRGDIVLKCLAAGSPSAAKYTLTPKESARYNPFNLFCLSLEEGFLYTNYPSPRSLTIDKGIHVLTNGDMDNHEEPRKNWIMKKLAALTTEAVPAGPESLMTLFAPVLSTHGHEGATEICIHLEGYGTVSSCMIFIHRDWGKSRYFYCQGSPCKNRYQDLSKEFVQLFRH